METKDEQINNDETTLLETPATQADLPLASGVGRRSLKPVAPQTSKQPARPSSLGRGAISAIALLVVFLPIIAGLIYLLFDSTTKYDSLRKTLRLFNESAVSQNSGDFYSLVAENDVQIIPFKTEDRSPNGRLVLFKSGRLRWAISYGKLEALPDNKIYVVWVTKNNSSGSASYAELVALPDIRTGGNAVVIPETSFPPSFEPSVYSELIVTVETIDKIGNQPAGPRRFSLDLAKLP